MLVHRPLQLLREHRLINRIRQLNWQRDALIAVCAVFLFAFIGPFGTFSQLTFMPRLVFWSIAILGGGILFWTIIQSVINFKQLQRFPKFMRLMLGAFLAAFPGTFLILFDKLMFMAEPITLQRMPWIWFTVFIISIAIGALHTFTHFGKSLSQNKAHKVELDALHIKTDAGILTFLERLPADIGSDLVSLSMQDHYMEVVTLEGTTTLHMKLADALEELKNYPGLRVHRSHWVAESEVQTLKRQGRNSIALLKDGRTLPVSARYKKALEALIGTV